MPSQTFFNLPKEKQQTIYDAAIKEFSRVTFDEASINQIIQTAHISRGSFYMYFKDKEDLYYYLVTTHKKNIGDTFIKIFKKNKGDIFCSYKELFPFLVKQISMDPNKLFLKNIFLNANFRNRSFFHEGKDGLEYQKMNDFISLIDTKNLNIANVENLYDIVDICNMCMIHSLIKIIKWNQDSNMVSKKFERQLLLLKEGLYKEEI